jgi:hypothetical protein
VFEGETKRWLVRWAHPTGAKAGKDQCAKRGIEVLSISNINSS